MIRVDFDKPTYLRAPMGLAVISPRLNHILPDEEYSEQSDGQLEPVVINRVYTPITKRLEVPKTKDEAFDEEQIKGEFIPRDSCDDAYQAEYSYENVSAVEATEISFHGDVGKSFSGVYAGSGHSHYRFNKKNGMSFYLRIGKHLIWGVELATAIRRSQAEKGQLITVTFLGKTPLSVLKEKVVNGHRVSEWVQTHRNSWEITVND